MKPLGAASAGIASASRQCSTTSGGSRRDTDWEKGRWRANGIIAPKSGPLRFRRAPGVGPAFSRNVVAGPAVVRACAMIYPLFRPLLFTLDPETVNNTLGVLLTYQDDIERIAGEEAARLGGESKAAAE